MAIQIWDAQAGQYKSADLARFGGSGTLTEALVWDGTQYVKVWPSGGGALWSDDFDTSDTTLWDTSDLGGVSPWHSGGETVTTGLGMACTSPVPDGHTVVLTLGTIGGNKAINFAMVDDLSNPSVSGFGYLIFDPELDGIVGWDQGVGFVSPVAGDTVALVRDGGYIYLRYNGQDVPDIVGSGDQYLRSPYDSNLDAYFVFQYNDGIAVDSIRCIPN